MNIDDTLKEIKSELLVLFSDNFKNLKSEYQKDLDYFLSLSEEKLKRWTILLIEEKITKEEFEWLIKSQKELLVLTSLSAAGLSKIKLTNIKNQAISLIIKTILTSII